MRRVVLSSCWLLRRGLWHRKVSVMELFSWFRQPTHNILRIRILICWARYSYALELLWKVGHLFELMIEFLQLPHLGIDSSFDTQFIQSYLDTDCFHSSGTCSSNPVTIVKFWHSVVRKSSQVKEYLSVSSEMIACFPLNFSAQGSSSVRNCSVDCQSSLEIGPRWAELAKDYFLLSHWS